MREINVIKSRNGARSISVDGILLHSRYDPYREAEVFAESNIRLLENRIVILYGAAFAYHIKSMLNFMDKYSKLYVFDMDEEIVRIANKFKMYENIKKDSRVEFNFGCSYKLMKKFTKLIDHVEDIIVYKPSLKVLPNRYDKFKQILMNYNIAKIGINKMAPIMRENTRINLNKNYPFIDEFFNKYNFNEKPIVVTSSGPSLDYDLNDLKKYRKYVSIFCVGSSLKTLMDEDIVPDAIFLIDGSEIVKYQLQGFENLDIPLCFLNTASRWAVSSYRGPKYVFFNEASSKSEFIINTGGTVALAAIDIAVKSLAREIIMLGQDLAFIDNKNHTDGFNKIYNKLHTNNKIDNNKTLYKKVKSIDDKILYTTSGYLRFKYYIEREIKCNKSVRFINCSKGAKILGAECMTFEEWAVCKIKY